MNTLKAMALLIVVLMFAFADVRAVGSACVTNDEEREHIRKVMLAAIEEALKKRLGHLFDVWVSEKGVRSGRAMAGADLNISTYNEARVAVFNWNPPLCGGRGAK